MTVEADGAAVPVEEVDAGAQVASAFAAAAVQRTRPIEAAAAPAVGISTVAGARSRQEDTVTIRAGYTVTINAFKSCPLPSTVVE